MPNSPTNDQNYSNTQKRICDFCSESVALIYCRADSAKLCLTCDREVHSTNQLFTKHTRFQLCDACNISPATIFCCTENSVLCQNCDYEVHTKIGSSLNHDRRPLEGFTGCPSVFELSGFIGFDDFDAKSLILSDESSNNYKGFNGGLFNGLYEENNDGFSDLFVWDVPTMVNLDDLIVSTDKSHNFHAMVVPPLPKDRNLSCGQHKHEILHQLRELAKSEPGIQQDALAGHHSIREDERDCGVQHMIRAYQHNEEQPPCAGNEASPYTWCNDSADAVTDICHSSALSGSQIEERTFNSDRPSNICSSANFAMTGNNLQNPIINYSSELPQKVSTRELCSAERGSAISRYKEKKRTRRFQKHIRYESRKVQAENRTRFKGRFAKFDNSKNQA